jgi:hypothetical protein
MRFDLHPFKDIEAAREWARNEIDQAAGAARARYITVTHGQDATYQAKYAEAQALVRAGYPEDQIELFPWIAAEAEATGTSPRTAADEIRANGDPWNAVLGPKIEGLRIGGKSTLAGMTAIAGVVTLTRAVQAKLAEV